MANTINIPWAIFIKVISAPDVIVQWPGLGIASVLLDGSGKTASFHYIEKNGEEYCFSASLSDNNTVEYLGNGIVRLRGEDGLDGEDALEEFTIGRITPFEFCI